MPHFNTTILRTTFRSPLTLLSLASDETQDVDDLETEHETELDVVVEYAKGWFQSGRFSGPPEDCYPDEGQGPEILAVHIKGEEQRGSGILSDLTVQEIMTLEDQADQAQREEEEAERDYNIEDDYKARIEERQWRYNDADY